MDTNKITVSTAISPEIREHLDSLATLHQTSPDQLMAVAIEKFVKKESRKISALEARKEHKGSWGE